MHKHKGPLNFRSAGLCSFQVFQLGAIMTAHVLPAMRVEA
jgi:hypothetical protein